MKDAPISVRSVQSESTELRLAFSYGKPKLMGPFKVDYECIYMSGLLYVFFYHGGRAGIEFF